ncbi:MAG: radical SAM protein [Proteobacteria bacterium]|nr:radical SAM protein [Pseudomonadota bacterium]
MNGAASRPIPTGAHVQTNETARVVLVGERRSPEAVLSRHLGPAFDDYRERWRLADEFIRRPDWPLHLDVDTNYTCNLRCVMCPLGVGGFPVAYDRKHLDFDLYKRVLDEGAANGLASVRLGLTGEPLLRKDIAEFVRAARDHGLLDVMLITNGHLLTPDVSLALIEAGLTRLMVSIDAVRPETYRRIRRGGELETVTRNVHAFLDLRRRLGSDLPLLRLSFVKMSFNEDEQSDFSGYWSDKADYISFQEYTNILETESTRYFTGNRVRAPRFRCPDPWQRMSLFVNGDLFPCCSDFGRLAPMGNAGETSVGRVWRSEAALALARLHQEGRWRENDLCRRCAANSTAQGGSDD